MSNWTYVIAAYAVTWIAVGAYALTITRKRRRLESELQGHTE